MKKLPDLPKFCSVCLAGPALNDNTGALEIAYRLQVSGPRNGPFDIFSVEWHIICHSTDLHVCCRTTANLSNDEYGHKNRGKKA